MNGRTVQRALLLAAAGLALAQRGTPARRAPDADIDWVRIPAGSFLMGSSADADTLPVHRVSLPAFEMMRAPVTFGQYRACVRAGACPPAGECALGVPAADDEPVVCVTWRDARDFARWAGGRLPSEAEWEYAAKGAGLGAGPCVDDGGAVCPRLTGVACERAVCSQPGRRTPQGLCDMTGDAWEWVEDAYRPTYDGAPSDGRAWEASADAARVSRLGSWKRCPGDVGADSRDHDPPSFSQNLLGFRLARSVP